MIRSPAKPSRISGRLRHLALGACIVAPSALGLTVPAAAQATPAILPGDGLVELVLPYSPYVFDLLVSFGRSFVAITYDQRGYDPVTRDFFVHGLKIGRDGIDVAVERVRVNASMALYEGIEIDTRNIPMEAEAREALREFGAEIIRGDLVTSVVADTASATYDIDLKADFDNIGSLAVAAEVEGFHVLVPLDDYTDTLGTTPGEEGAVPAEPFAQNDAPVLLGRLRNASISYDDAGLTPAGLAFAAEAQGMAPQELRGMMAIMLTPMVSGLFAELPGGASPELQERALGWSTTLQAYLADPQHIEITFSPEEPFDLSQLKAGMALDEAMIVALNPNVSNVAAERTALIDPDTGTSIGDDDSMGLSERLVEGLGVPQDVGRGVALALSDVAAGDQAAADVVVRGIVLDPEGAVSPDTAQSSYVMLLLAKARGVTVPEAATAAIRSRLDVAGIAAAENSALEQWRATEAGAEQEAAEAAASEARDWDALRDLAFDYYEGQSVPRNLTRAFAFAQLSAAGGDRIAAALRNDLTAGLREGRLAFDVEAAREEAGTIWRGIVAAGNGVGDEDAAPDAQ